jgi:hypothetical protein
MGKVLQLDWIGQAQSLQTLQVTEFIAFYLMARNAL